jgi:hypothetical protein
MNQCHAISPRRKDRCRREIDHAGQHVSRLDRWDVVCESPDGTLHLNHMFINDICKFCAQERKNRKEENVSD